MAEKQDKKTAKAPRVAKPIDPNAPKCLVPGCDKPQKTRGLCVSCYTVARDLVKSGKTSWPTLVEAGRALSRGGVSGTKKAAATAWLMAPATAPTSPAATEGQNA